MAVQALGLVGTDQKAKRDEVREQQQEMAERKALAKLSYEDLEAE